MRKVFVEILLTATFVFVGTLFLYGRLDEVAHFWSAQNVWSAILMLGWIVVSAGYYHQGWLVHKGHTALHVSAVLPSAVFVVQCILFIKGVYFNDWSLMLGAIVVNSGVVFSLYQIIRAKRRARRAS